MLPSFRTQRSYPAQGVLPDATQSGEDAISNGIEIGAEIFDTVQKVKDKCIECIKFISKLIYIRFKSGDKDHLDDQSKSTLLGLTLI